jgi:hypothetical protein
MSDIDKNILEKLGLSIVPEEKVDIVVQERQVDANTEILAQLGLDSISAGEGEAWEKKATKEADLSTASLAAGSEVVSADVLSSLGLSADDVSSVNKEVWEKKQDNN